MKRRIFLGAGSAAAAGAAAQTASTAAAAGAGEAGPRTAGPPASTAGMPPRKVIVGTAMQAFWGEHPGLERRLAELTGLLDQMRVQSQRKYGRGPDLAILPEMAITGESGDNALARAVPYDGPVAAAFAPKAREFSSYVVVTAYFLEAGNRKACSNAAVLLDRRGQAAGTYRKVHLVPSPGGKNMEGGATAGRDLPVFDCDFGKLGIQICYDMEFDRGWQELARKGAELIAWPTQSPQTAQPAFRAMQQRAYIVSSTWRNNASVFEPTGKILAQIRAPERVLVEEIDLSYAILPWSSRLRKGKAFDEKFGAKAGYRYYEDEDCGIFWSNDAGLPVKRMVESLGLTEAEEQLAEVRRFYHRAGVLDY
jgi:predicted amidohydrolase